jgi:hypothetical protein
VSKRVADFVDLLDGLRRKLRDGSWRRKPQIGGSRGREVEPSRCKPKHDISDAEREAYLTGHHNGLVSMMKVYQGAVVGHASRMRAERPERIDGTREELSPLQHMTVQHMLEALQLMEKYHALAMGSRALYELENNGLVREEYQPVSLEVIDGESQHIAGVLEAALAAGTKGEAA